MKTLKRILTGIVIIIGIVLLIAAITRKDYVVVRETVINKPKQEVFDYVKYLKNQHNFSKWDKMDPNMKLNYKGTDGTAGFTSYWNSDKKDVGQGEQEIKGITEGEKIDYEIRFIRPFASVSPSYITTEAVSANQTKVKWGFSGKMPYPMNLMLLVMDMEKMIGDDLQTGLNNLKNILEKQP